jgi:peptidoglycan/LPS O-acetylase OafA/YrhL
LLLVLWPAGKDITLAQSLVNLTMLQTPLGVAHVDGVYWTLWVEFKFYILIGIFIMVGITKARVFALCMLWPVAAAIAELSESKLLVEILMPEFAPLFAGGMLLFLMFREGQTILGWLVMGMNALIAAQQAAGGEFLTIQKLSGHDLPDSACFVAVLSLFGLVAVLTLTKLNSVTWAGLSTAGALTFPLYLLHEHWGWWLISLGSPHFPHLAVLPLVIALCLGMAWVIWRFVEKPVNPILRLAVQRGLDRLRAPQADERHRTGPK